MQKDQNKTKIKIELKLVIGKNLKWNKIKNTTRTKMNQLPNEVL